MLKIQNGNFIYPPNKILRRKYEISKTPVIYDHLLFLEFNKSGQCFVGSSNLNGTLWEGTLLYFEQEQYLENLSFKKSYIGSTSSDGKFLNNDTIVVAEDNGLVTILKCLEGEKIEIVQRFKEINHVPRISVWDDSDKFLTCSENVVTLWNITGEKPNHLFKNYHTELVNAVDTIKNNHNMFISTAADLKCLMWDVRNSNPAFVLYKSCSIHITTIASNQNDTNIIAIGKENGDVCLIDRRKPLQNILVTNCEFSIHRLLFDESEKLAACGDTKKVVVWDCKRQNFERIYSNDSKHVDIVRGLGWYQSTLYSCGFGKQIVKHSV